MWASNRNLHSSSSSGATGAAPYVLGALGPAAGAEQVMAAIRQKWGYQGDDLVLRVLAEQLVQRRDPLLENPVFPAFPYALSTTYAKGCIKNVISDAWQQEIMIPEHDCPLEVLLASRADGRYFSIQPMLVNYTKKKKKKEQVLGQVVVRVVVLDTQALLADQAASSSSSSSSVDNTGPAAAAAAAAVAAPATGNSSSSSSLPDNTGPAAAAASIAGSSHKNSSSYEATGAGPVVDPNAAAAAASNEELLLAAIRQKWGQQGYDGVLRVLAEQLVQQSDPEVVAPYTMRTSFAKTCMRRFISSAWQKGSFFTGVGCPLEQLLASRADGQQYFTVRHLPAVGAVVFLNIPALLAGQDNASPAAGGAAAGGVEAAPAAVNSSLDNTSPAPVSAKTAPANSSRIDSSNSHSSSRADAASPAAAAAAPAGNRGSTTTSTKYVVKLTTSGVQPASGSMAEVMAAAKAAARETYQQLLLAQRQTQQPA